jgi:uncharacterized protein YqjF (DUF2071 family)
MTDLTTSHEQHLAVPAPPLRWRDAVTDLLDFALLNWWVAPEALAAHLPDDFEPEIFDTPHGPRALISAVPFRDEGFHFLGAPWLRVTMGQTNYRAYVRYQGRSVVWFFGTSLTGWTRVVPRWLWRLPWHGARMRFDTAWDGARCTRYTLEARSRFAPLSLVMAGSDQPMGSLPGFTSEDHCRAVLTHPFEGYYHRRDGAVGGYRVWHDVLELQRATVTQIDCPLWARLGLCARDALPNSALVMRRTRFHIHLPPVVVRQSTP